MNFHLIQYFSLEHADLISNEYFVSFNDVFLIKYKESENFAG